MLLDNPVNEMVRRLISTQKVGDCVGRFKEDYRHADSPGNQAIRSLPYAKILLR
ncbi:hypothetical protein AciX9_4276 (plasmid) [Granulicella tundricola MP5ACTX9]|uniref:Uncharacterized protein n=1 Tax=Granulicella tundricola (strain ATCC BAA-1859 / DSM 23138 / MP5ACTX9) TaxID=1198114 RepID=E8X6G3_GRATM|nr:hypothetical protein AciX9_4276 [Granulicella tundricola MP5ACTX9]